MFGQLVRVVEMIEDALLYRNPEEYLQVFARDSTISISDLVNFYNHIDFCGSPVLSICEYESSIKKYDSKFKEHVEKRSFCYCNEVLLRGKHYYPGYLGFVRSNALKFISTSLEHLHDYAGCFISNLQKCEKLADRVILSQFLDYRKNIALLLFTGLFQSMLEYHSIPICAFQEAYDFCEESISDYYEFIISGRISRILDYDTNEIISNLHPEIAYPNRRALSREMDHPGRILLYSANLCNIVNSTYDFCINPLRGATEIGFAVKTISTLVNKKVIDKISFVRYSTHDERHAELKSVGDLFQHYIPNQLLRNYKKIQNKKVIVIDDNISTGDTLANINKVLTDFCSYVSTSVVEINRDKLYNLLAEKRLSRRCFLTKDLIGAAIGEWRDQTAIREIIEKRVNLAENIEKFY